MEDSRWFRLITIGLILAALAVGYFLLSGRLTSNSFIKTKPQTTNEVSGTASATPSASVLGQDVQTTPTSSPKQTPSSAYDRIANRNQNQVQTLPKTGFSQVLAGIFSVGVMISGWGLRKYPHY
ncbi:MAG: hypothetical protein PHV63_00525 [Candidatus Daviesbacteria bacterium]|nr:hypothetical protein [Candidatus Daviesbacteria bacterium]